MISSGSARIFVSVPAAGAGTSASTLSVEISTRGSSASTRSPTCLRHSRTVPSVTDSPIWGIVICTVVVGVAIPAFKSPRGRASSGAFENAAANADADGEELHHVLEQPVVHGVRVQLL